MAKDYDRKEQRQALRTELNAFARSREETSEPSLPQPTLEEQAMLADMTADDGTESTYGQPVFLDMREQPGLHIESPNRRKLRPAVTQSGVQYDPDGTPYGAMYRTENSRVERGHHIA